MWARSARTLGIVALCLASALAGLGCWPRSGSNGAVLVIDSTPEQGASVRIGAKIVGKTPCRVEGIKPGLKGVVAYLDGYKRYAEVVDVPEEGELDIMIELFPVEGFLSITSEPSHAFVYLDGTERLGRTPMHRQSVPAGQHSYEVVLEDYAHAKGKLYIEDSIGYQYHHLLKPLDARLSVVSRPSGAKIWINDRPLEEVTPTQLELPPGDYTIGVHTEGHIMSETSVRLGANEDRIVELTMLKGRVPLGMVLVPASEFIFGRNNESPDEAPARKIFLKAYYIDKHEVTNLAFKKVFPNHVYSSTADLFPVSGVSWKQAQEYAETVGKRLPTEQEWEKAARGPDSFEFPWGDRLQIDRLNFAAGPSRSGTERVGSYRAGASPYGCLDMAGNVYEWLADWYEPYPGNENIKTTYGQIYRVLRGGSYLSNAYDVRAPRRHYDRPGNRRADYGFRCARDVDRK